MGTVAEEQLEDVRERLVGLSGLPGQEVHLQELVLKSGLPDRPDLHLQHSLPVGSDDSRGGSAGRCVCILGRESWLTAVARRPYGLRSDCRHIGFPVRFCIQDCIIAGLHAPPQVDGSAVPAAGGGACLY